MHTFPKSISAMQNAHSLSQVWNSGQRIHSFVENASLYMLYYSMALFIYSSFFIIIIPTSH